MNCPEYELNKTNIFLVEDNQDDIFLIQLAVKECEMDGNYIIAQNGKKAIEIMENFIYENKNFPDLIFLDVNLPKITGLEVLKKIKSEKKLKYIPLVVFTSSDSVSDMKYCYENNADLYIRKPNNISDFKEIVKYIKKNLILTI